MGVKRGDLLKGEQLPMFLEGEDLPLFSGTAQRAPDERFEQHDAWRQSSMAECAVCLDTGRVDGKYCTCSAGRRERERDRREDEGAAACESAFGFGGW